MNPVIEFFAYATVGAVATLFAMHAYHVARATLARARKKLRRLTRTTTVRPPMNRTTKRRRSAR